MHVDRLVKRCVSIYALRPDGSHEFVKLVRNEVGGSGVRDAVNDAIERHTLRRIGGVAVLFVKLGNLVQIGLLGFVVHSPVTGRPLEHQVFEVVRQARGFGRVVLTPHTHCDIGLDAGLALVHRKINLQPVGEGINPHPERIAWYGSLHLGLLCERNQRH